MSAVTAAVGMPSRISPEPHMLETNLSPLTEISGGNITDCATTPSVQHTVADDALLAVGELIKVIIREAFHLGGQVVNGAAAIMLHVALERGYLTASQPELQMHAVRRAQGLITCLLSWSVSIAVVGFKYDTSTAAVLGPGCHSEGNPPSPTGSYWCSRKFHCPSW